VHPWQWIKLLSLLKLKLTNQGSPKANVAHPLVIGTDVVASHLTLTLLGLLEYLILLFSNSLAVGLFLEIVITVANYNVRVVFDLSQSKCYLSISTWWFWSWLEVLLRSIDDSSGTLSRPNRLSPLYVGLWNRCGRNLLTTRRISDRLFNCILLGLFEALIIGHHFLQLVLRHLVDVLILLKVTKHFLLIVYVIINYTGWYVAIGAIRLFIRLIVRWLKLIVSGRLSLTIAYTCWLRLWVFRRRLLVVQLNLHFLVLLFAFLEVVQLVIATVPC
jgi:hypothetical protein